MNEYQKKMQQITPSAALNARVLEAAQAEGNRKAPSVQRRLKPSIALLAAALCLLLCVGAAASGIYYTRTLLPGHGVVVTENTAARVLDRVIPFGEQQIDYVILTHDGTAGELRVIVTGGTLETGSDFKMQKIKGDKYGDFTVEQTSYFGQLTATLEDGSSYTLNALPADKSEGYSKLDVYTCQNFPAAERFTLSAVSGETAEISLVEYDESAAVIEKQTKGITLRVIPLAQGSRYVFFDCAQSVLGENWEQVSIPMVTLIDEAGNRGGITTYTRAKLPVFGTKPYAYMIEAIGRMEEGMSGRIVDFQWIEGDTPPLQASMHPDVSADRILPLSFAFPAKGEQLVFDTPFVLFDEEGFTIAASSLTVEENGKLTFAIQAEDILAAPEHLRVTMLYGTFYLRTDDGAWYKGASACSFLDQEKKLSQSFTLKPADKMPPDDVVKAFGEQSGLLSTHIGLKFIVE